MLRFPGINKCPYLGCPTATAAGQLRLFAAILVSLAILAGCDQRGRGGKGAPATQASGTREGQASANTPRMVGRDSEDDPKSPSCLPKSQDNGTWTKVEPARMFSAGQMAGLFGDAGVHRTEGFRIRSGARCAYSLRRSTGAMATAVVVLVEGNTVEDAYGLMSCMCNSPEMYRIGGETRVDHAGGLTFHCWQGKSYVRVGSPDTDPETTEEMIRLLMAICAKIPSEEPPGITKLFPSEQRRAGRFWVVRSLSSIAPESLELGAEADLGRIGAILGLGKDTIMCVSGYDVPEAVRPNTVWVVNYPTIKAALDAYARYARIISQGRDPIGRSASVLPAQGTYLIGTWTAEEESMQYVLPRIAKLLPS